MNIEPYPVKTNDYTIVDKGKSYFDTYKIGNKDGEEKTIDRILEMVDKNKRISFQVLYTGTPNPAAFAAIEAIENYVNRLRRDILEMKEGKQECE